MKVQSKKQVDSSLDLESCVTMDTGATESHRHLAGMLMTSAEEPTSLETSYLGPPVTVKADLLVLDRLHGLCVYAAN